MRLFLLTTGGFIVGLTIIEIDCMDGTDGALQSGPAACRDRHEQSWKDNSLVSTINSQKQPPFLKLHCINRYSLY